MMVNYACVRRVNVTLFYICVSFQYLYGHTYFCMDTYIIFWTHIFIFPKGPSVKLLYYYSAYHPSVRPSVRS